MLFREWGCDWKYDSLFNSETTLIQILYLIRQATEKSS